MCHHLRHHPQSRMVLSSELFTATVTEFEFCWFLVNFDLWMVWPKHFEIDVHRLPLNFFGFNIVPQRAQQLSKVVEVQSNVWMISAIHFDVNYQCLSLRISDSAKSPSVTLLQQHSKVVEQRSDKIIILKRPGTFKALLAIRKSQLQFPLFGVVSSSLIRRGGVKTYHCVMLFTSCI